jgi:prolyl oligopeptidase
MKTALFPCIAAMSATLLVACAPAARKPAAPVAAPAKETAVSEDPYLWLEDIHGEKPLAWVETQNARTQADFADTPAFGKTRDAILGILDSDAKIPYVSKIGDRYYNFWKDKDHPRGVWRRTTLAEYRKDKPNWETVIDLDALGKAEGKSWVWHGAQCLKPADRRCLVSLSPGGGDADVVREFDLHDKAFVKGGFELPEAKTQVAWIDENRIYVATDFGPGSMTKSSYARIVKEWRRGTPLADATTVYEGKDDDLAIGASRDLTAGFERDFVVRTIDFFTSETFVRGKDGQLAKIDVPFDANVDAHREWLTIHLRSAWTVDGKTYPSGALLAAKFDDFMDGKRDLVMLFAPTDTTSLEGASWTRHHLILNLLDNVASRQEVLTPAPHGDWKREPLAGAPALSTVVASAVDADKDDSYFLTVSSFLEPDTLAYGTLGRGKAQTLKRGPVFFDASAYQAQQFFATSKDGTRVPYFQLAAKDIKLDGSNPTLLYGYGGFEVSLQPKYSGAIGKEWLARGGVYVLANIRGGGEYGPRWHQAALKANRLRAYEDFAAVADDLVHRGVTSRAPGRDGRQQRRSAHGQHAHAISGPLRRDRLRRAAARHEALHAPVRRRVVDRGIRRSGQGRRVGVDQDLLAVPERRRRQGLPADPVLYRDQRRSRRPGAGAQDGRAHGGNGLQKRLVLREPRGRPRGRGGQPPVVLHDRAELFVPVETAHGAVALSFEKPHRT